MEPATRILRSFVDDGVSPAMEEVARTRQKLQQEDVSTAMQPDLYAPCASPRTVVDTSVTIPSIRYRLARLAYNRCLQSTTGKPTLLMTHMRSLALVVMAMCERDVSKWTPSALTSRVKHWGRTAVAFGICKAESDADECFGEATSLLSLTSSHDDPLVLEAEILVKGWQAADEVLLGARRYLAEHVAFAAAAHGYLQLAEKKTDPPYNQAALIRLLDLATGLLPDSDQDAYDLRDRITRLRAWLCIEEGDVDMAAQALSRHVDASNDEYRLLNYNLLFRTHRPGEACSQVLSWVRDTAPGRLSFDGAMDAIALLIEKEEKGAARQTCHALVERLRGAFALANGSPPQELCAAYAEAAEMLFHILTEIAPDSAACADHLEACLDGHTSDRFSLNENTLRMIASKLWEQGALYYHENDLHRASIAIENAFRFLEHTTDKGATARAQATLAHCYLLQERLEQAVDRARHAIQLGAQLGLDLRERGVVLIKSRLKLRDVQQAHADIERFVRSGHTIDHLLLGSLCEEVSAMGDEYTPSAILILQHFVQRLDHPPAVDSHNPSTPTLERTKLLAITRALVILRLRVPPATENHWTALISDLELVARRVEQEGLAAVCDDPVHADWLGESAWNLGCEALAGENADTSVKEPAKDPSPPSRVNACASFLTISFQLSASLPMTDARLQRQLRCQMLIGRCFLSLFDDTAVEKRQESVAQQHIQKASAAVQLAFRLHQRSSQSGGIELPHASGHGADLWPMLHLLNVEVALRRNDPNLQHMLTRAMETKGVGASHLVELAERSEQLRNRDFCRLALEHALGQLLHNGTDQLDYGMVSAVIRHLITIAGGRAQARPFFVHMGELLADFSSSNCPMDHDDLHWFAVESWNRGVMAFKERNFDDAEEWMAGAFVFVKLSNGFGWLREKMAEQYKICLKQIANSHGEKERKFRVSLSKRICAPSGESAGNGPILELGETSSVPDKLCV
ncbi:hypothetical protein AB1Y20_006074 [Prymnesium parvum]|uniref:Protein ZIP4 homolog n=1 Tax=Prymnesium parvum TaxID=97485 RepID=A0AB34J3W7_PRYPA